uniref:Evasin n=1 Tax=Rhipicephalus sanguineus TaxID=34632 RepID=C9W1C3_RHISA
MAFKYWFVFAAVLYDAEENEDDSSDYYDASPMNCSSMSVNSTMGWLSMNCTMSCNGTTFPLSNSTHCFHSYTNLTVQSRMETMTYNCSVGTCSNGTCVENGTTTTCW